MATFTEVLSLLLVIFKFFVVASRVKNVSAACEPLQYAEFGQQGLIECNFTSGFTGVYWYLHVETGYQVIIRLEKQEDGSLARSGAGYIEKKFDILSNGSLILTNVSDFHNQSFKIVHVDKDLRVKEIYVELVTSILPDVKFPLISACNGSRLCFVEEIQSHILTCSFNHSKPAVNLTWHKLSPLKPETLPGKTLVSEDEKWTFSSVLKTNITSYLNGQLTAFSCRASSPVLKSHGTESIVIIDSTKQHWPSLEGNVVEENYFIRNSEANVHCTDIARPHILVWAELGRNSSHVVGFVVNGFIRTLSDLDISHDGSLTFSKVTLDNEGLYWCKISDGIKYGSNLKQVKIFVPPVSPEIFVAECPSYENECEILIQDPPLRISCSLKGVYPNVTLNMESTFERELRIINKTTYPIGMGNLFDATITKEISSVDCSTSLIITCKISNPAFLEFIPEKIIVLRSEECEETGLKVAAVVTTVIFVLITACVLAFILCRRKACRHKVKQDAIEENEIVPESHSLMDSSGNHDESKDSKPQQLLEKESIPEESLSVKDETRTSHTEEVEEAMNSKKEIGSKESMASNDSVDISHNDERVETVVEDALQGLLQKLDETRNVLMNSKKENDSKESMASNDIVDISHNKERVETMVKDAKQGLLQMLDETLNVLMSHALKNAPKNYVFNETAITIVRDNPVEIQFKKDAWGFSFLYTTAAVLLFFLFGFGVVLALAGALMGLTGVAIGLSSKELIDDPSKWKKVKPVLISLIEVVKNIAQATALACYAQEAVKNIRQNKVIVHEATIQGAHSKIKRLIEKHTHVQSLNQNDFLKCCSRIKNDMEQVLHIMKTTYTFTSWNIDEKITTALENPFSNLDADALACIDYYDSGHGSSGYVSFINRFFIGGQTGEISKTASLEEDFKKTRCSESTKKTVEGTAAACVVLKAANVEIDLEFLGTDLEKLLDQKEERTLALTATVNLMEKINAIFGKLEH